MNRTQQETGSPSRAEARTRRPRSVAAHPATRGIAFVLTIAAFFFLLWLLGPIDLKGNKRQLGLFFVAVALPICGAVWMYDPIVRRLDQWFYPEVAAQRRKAAAPASAEKKERTHRLSRKSRETHPVSTNRLTPYLFALAAIGVFLGLNWLVYELGLSPENDAGAGTYIVIVATVLASIRGYDPIVDALDSWFGQPQI